MKLTETKEFCCYALQVLECETKPISQCNPSYAAMNIRETRRAFSQYCFDFWIKCEPSKFELALEIFAIIIGFLALLAGTFYCCTGSAIFGVLNVIFDSLGITICIGFSGKKIYDIVKKFQRTGRLDVEDLLIM